MQFHQKQVVWAKVKGYPWWPAYINKLPQDSDGNFKVIFFAQDTQYHNLPNHSALLQPRCVQKFSQSYNLHSKTKAKKFTRALQLANTASNRTLLDPTPKSKKINKTHHKIYNKQPLQPYIQSWSQSLHSDTLSDKQAQFDSASDNQQVLALLDDTLQQIDKKKVQRVQDSLSSIITDLQSSQIKQWKHTQYFLNFTTQTTLNSQQLLHSNITRKLRYIIQTMRKLKHDIKYIQPLQQLSTSLKKKALDYLTDTTYYDQHIKLIDKTKHNKAQIENQITKILRKKYDGIKKDFINIIASQIGMQLGNKNKFRSRQLLNDLKQGSYDNIMSNLNSKAATQRIADQIIARYKQ